MRHSFLALALAALLIASYASASVINMALTLSTPTYLGPDSTGLAVEVLNSGDEPAYNAVAETTQPFGENVLEFVGVIEPGVKYESIIKLTPGTNAVPGVYYGFLRLQYTDMNGHPFSLVGPFVVRHLNDSYAKVAVSSGQAAIPSGGGSKTVRVEVENTDEVGHDVSFTVYSPKELSVGAYSKSGNIPAKSSAGFDVPFESDGALKGSVYTIYYLAEYVSDGLHYSAVGQTHAEIVGEPEGSDLAWVPSALLFALIASFISYQLWHMIRGRA